MRKTIAKKNRFSRRLLAICISASLVLSSMTALAFADEAEEEQQIDQPAVVKNDDSDKEQEKEPEKEEEPAAEEPAAEEPAAEEPAAEEPADTDAGTATDKPAKAPDQSGGGSISRTTKKSYNSAIGTTWYVGDSLTANGELYHTRKNNNKQFNNMKLPEPKFSTSTDPTKKGWQFQDIFDTGISFYDGGTQDKKPVGLTIVSGSGTNADPFILGAVYHEHAWSVKGEGAVATAVCEADHCPITNPPTVTIVPPTAAIYDGSAHVATTKTEGTAEGLVFQIGTISYSGKDTEGTAYSGSTGPVDAGSYTATVTVNVGNSTAKITCDFDVKPQSIPVEELEVTEPSGVTKDLTELEEIMLKEGDKVDLCIAGGEVEGAKFVYSTDGENYSDSIPTASKPGEYTVYYKLQPDKNHSLFGNLSGTITTLVMNYAFTEGEDSSWDMTSDDTFTFVAKRSREDGVTIDNFVSIAMDDEVIDEANYSKEPGSVKITLTNEYLKTLKEGDHSVKLSFDEGNGLTYELETTFTVKGSSAPQTGEYAGTIILVISALMVAAGTAFVIKARKA